jgi:hypothetical protein
MKTFYFCLSIILISSCEVKNEPSAHESFQTIDSNDLKKNESVNYSVSTFQNKNKDWGYQILKNNKAVINQPSIPAIQGNKGFSTEEKAKKTGEFVLQKILNGEFPPIVSLEDLDSLHTL